MSAFAIALVVMYLLTLTVVVVRAVREGPFSFKQNLLEVLVLTATFAFIALLGGGFR